MVGWVIRMGGCVVGWVSGRMGGGMGGWLDG